MINYQRVVNQFGGTLVSLTPRRAKAAGEESPGMTLKFTTEDGETITLDDTVCEVIDNLAAEVGGEDE